MSLDYDASPTVSRFMLDSTSLVRVIVGPLGSGKSMACIMELLRRATEQAPDGSRERHTRFAIIRNTMQQLRTTVLSDIMQYIKPIATYYTTDSTVRIRVPLPDGTTVISDWLLIPLDTTEDQKRLLSMQLTGAWINEVREVPYDIIKPLLGRLGRYPSALNGGFTWRGLIADTNPWSTDSPYHDALVLDPKSGWKLYHQPSGIGPLAENVAKLPAGYYDNLLDGRDTDWSDVHVESQWGTSNAGQAVFRRSFNAATHVVDMQAIINPLRPLIVGMDFGRTPTALLGQVDNAGVLNVYREVSTEDMGLIQMVQEQLMPVLTAEPYARARVAVVGDPAGTAKSSLGEETSFDTLKTLGLLACPAPTNAIKPRLTAVERLFRSTIAGGPAIRISRSGCPLLVRSLGDKYRYRKKRDGQLEDLPEKLHPWSDLADTLQYLALGASSNLVGRILARQVTRMPRDRVSAAGWT